MIGLTIIVATADPERWRAALTLASASAALGHRTRLYCHEAAVTVLAQAEALVAIARETGVEILACQTGLADHAMALPPGVEAGGLVSLLATLAEDRLVTL